MKEEIAREISKDIFEKKYGKKAKIEMWVCGNLKLSTSEETNCSECREKCYYDRELLYRSKKNTKFICVKCALKNHKKELSKEEIIMLEKIK